MQSGLGNVVPLGADTAHIPAGSPPTSYAAHAVVTGQSGALLRFVGFTLLRSLLIAPGIAIAGIRGKQLLWGSLAASGAISAASLGYAYVSRKASQPASANAVSPLPMPPPVDTTGETVAEKPAPTPVPQPEEEEIPTVGVQGGW